MVRNYTFSGYFWEHQNHNGVVTLVNRMKMGKQTCEKLKAVYEIKASSEEQYAATLLQMVTDLQTCDESGQLGKALNAIQEQWTHLANAHLRTAKDLNADVIQPLSTLLTKQKQLRRELQANVTKFYNNRQLQTHCVLRAQDRYNAECTKANELMQQSSAKEKHLTYKRANAVIKKVQQAYDDAMDDLKMVTEEWNKQWQLTCREFDLLEEERLSFLQTNIYTCNDYLSRTLGTSAQAYEEIARTVDLMDVDADLDDFVQRSGGVETIPDAMDYIKLYVLQESTKSQDDDDNQQDNVTATHTVSHTSTTMNNESYTTLESDGNAVDMIDPNDNGASLMVGRMEMYNSDDDNFTDSDYDNNGDSDYEYEQDEPMDDDSSRTRYGESHYDLVGNNDHQQNHDSEEDGDMDNGHFQGHQAEQHYDNDVDQDFAHHKDETSLTASPEYMNNDEGYDMITKENKSPLAGLGIEGVHERSPHNDTINEMKGWDGEQLVQQPKQNPRHEATHHRKTDDQHPSAAPYSMRKQEQSPPSPPLHDHQYYPTSTTNLADDNTSMVATPVSRSSNGVNEELDNMLRQLEQQTINRPDNTTLESRSTTKKASSSARIRLSGVRPRAPKNKPGHKLLKELAGIDIAASNDINGGEKSSTIVAGSDEWPLDASPSDSLASRKDFFDPFSSLGTMSYNSLSIASSTPSTPQVQKQQQKQQKWMLDEVTQAMQQNNKIKRRPLPDRPMKSTTEQAEHHIQS